jgi:hypothetical protein
MLQIGYELKSSACGKSTKCKDLNTHPIAWDIQNPESFFHNYQIQNNHPLFLVT